MDIPSKLVGNVEKIEVWIEHGENDSSLVISVTGITETSNFTEPMLKYVDNVGDAPRGVHPHDVYDFQFWVKPPQVGQSYAMQATPIAAQFRWAGYSKNLKVIRVHSKAGFHEKWVELGGPGTPVEDAASNTSGTIA